MQIINNSGKIGQQINITNGGIMTLGDLEQERTNKLAEVESVIKAGKEYQSLLDELSFTHRERALSIAKTETDTGMLWLEKYYNSMPEQKEITPKRKA